MLQYNKDPTILPVLQLPTLNGNIININWIRLKTGFTK